MTACLAVLPWLGTGAAALLGATLGAIVCAALSAGRNAELDAENLALRAGLRRLAGAEDDNDRDEVLADLLAAHIEPQIPAAWRGTALERAARRVP